MRELQQQEQNIKHSPPCSTGSSRQCTQTTGSKEDLESTGSRDYLIGIMGLDFAMLEKTVPMVDLESQE
eukprot:11409653-Ditylum_brightwellii.AAC.1